MTRFLLWCGIISSPSASTNQIRMLDRIRTNGTLMRYALDVLL